VLPKSDNGSGCDFSALDAQCSVACDTVRSNFYVVVIEVAYV
jgi:hypothetical protein